MKTVEPWKAIALVIVFCAIATTVNSLYANRNVPSSSFAPGGRAAQPSTQAYSAPAADLQRQNAELQKQKAEAEAHAELLDRYVNTPLSRNPQTPTYGLVVISDSRTFDHVLNSALSRHFKNGSNEILSFPLKPAFVSDGLFDTAFDGSVDRLQKLDLAKVFDALILGRETVGYTMNTSLANVLTATMQLEIVVVSLNGNGVGQTWSFRANGAGFSQSDARAMAEERIIKQIGTATQMTLAN